MRQSIQRTLHVTGCLLALSGPVLLLPMFVADARNMAAPADATHINKALTRHDARYVMRAYSRVPLQCASEVHGA